MNVFDNFYTPLWGVSTSDGEYVTTTGLIPKSGVWSYSLSSALGKPLVGGLEPLVLLVGDEGVKIDGEGVVAGNGLRAEDAALGRRGILRPENLWTGYFEGKNLIWIVAEGFSTLAMDPQRTPTQ